MNNERYNQIIDEMWINYMNHNNDENGYECKLAGREICIKLQFINKCNTDSEFSEKWGLKIEERELSLEERMDYGVDILGYMGMVDFGDHQTNDLLDFMDKYNIPTKLTTINYNGQIQESYE